MRFFFFNLFRDHREFVSVTTVIFSTSETNALVSLPSMFYLPFGGCVVALMNWRVSALTREQLLCSAQINAEPVQLEPPVFQYKLGTWVFLWNFLSFQCEVLAQFFETLCIPNKTCQWIEFSLRTPPPSLAFEIGHTIYILSFTKNFLRRRKHRKIFLLKTEFSQLNGGMYFSPLIFIMPRKVKHKISQ